MSLLLAQHRVPNVTMLIADELDAAATAIATVEAGPPSPSRTSTAKTSIIDELKDLASDVHKKCSTEAEKKKYFKLVR